MSIPLKFLEKICKLYHEDESFRNDLDRYFRGLRELCCRSPYGEPTINRIKYHDDQPHEIKLFPEVWESWDWFEFEHKVPGYQCSYGGGYGNERIFSGMSKDLYKKKLDKQIKHDKEKQTMKSNFKAEIERFIEMSKDKMVITCYILFDKNDVSEVAYMVSFFTKDKAFAAFNQCYANYVCLCSVLPKNGECGCDILILKEK